MSTLPGHRALVIGGSSGLGRGLARALASRGADVLLTTSRPDGVDQAIDGVRADLAPSVPGGVLGKIECVRCDLLDETSVTAAVDRIGHLDHLAVIGAPPTPAASAPPGTPESACERGYVDARLWGAHAAGFAARERMPDTGSILFVSATPALRPLQGMWYLTVAFGAIEALTRALSVDFAPVRVNCIRVGVFDTPLWDNLGPQAREDWLAWRTDGIPLARPGTADEFGEAAVGVLTATYMTGAVVSLDGGRMLPAD